MNRPSTEQMVKNLLQAFEMHDFGVEMMRQNLRREHPQESAEQIEARVKAWLGEHPGAEHGDAEGRPGSLDRFK